MCTPSKEIPKSIEVGIGLLPCPCVVEVFHARLRPAELRDYGVTSEEQVVRQRQIGHIGNGDVRILRNDSVPA